jgi:trehalose 2-sulfotransferase
MAPDLVGVEADRPPGRAWAPPRWSYLLCCTPRCGSTLLSEALHATGRLGTPIEYFDRTNAYRRLYARWRCRDLTDYVAALWRWRTADGGVLGAKLHWFQLDELARELVGIPCGSAYRRARAAVELVFPHCRYLRVIRRDRDRQALSWAIGEQTGRWALGPGEAPASPARYDFAAISERRRLLDRHERHWGRYFAALGVTPFTVVYEDLVRDYRGTVVSVARRLGVELDRDEVAPPRLRRQADERTEALLARYREERGNGREAVRGRR